MAVSCATAAWFAERVGAQWADHRARLLDLLQRDAELREVAGLLGADALQDSDRAILEVARIVREHILGQNAFDPNDAYSTLEKTGAMAELAVAALDAANAALDRGVAADEIDLRAVRRAFAELRRSPADLDIAIDGVREAIAAIAGEAVT